MTKLRWKMEPRETGLRAIGAGPRASRLHDGTTIYAMVYALRRGHATLGWYWVAGWDSDIPGKNTCYEPVESAAEAKVQAMAYVREHLGKAKKEPPQCNE